MARKGGLTVIAIKNLGAKATRYEVPDPGCPGLYVVVQPSGAKSWVYRYRFGGKSRKLTIGGAITDKGIEVISIGDARDVADEARVQVARKIDPIEAGRAKQQAAAAEAAAALNTVRVVAVKYLAECANLRTVDQREKIFSRIIYPAIGARQVESIKRSEIIKLLDDVATERGEVIADRVLATLRAFLNWYAVQSDDYRSPIVARMARTSTKDRARDRTLFDIELRALWRASEEAGLVGAYVRFLLLTAARRNEAAQICGAEIDGTDWTIPGSRYKNGLDHIVPLSTAALNALNSIKRISGTDFIFATPDGKPIRGFGSRKEVVDKLMLTHLRELAGDDVSLKRWTFHDLRRTARTLMGRAGVPSEIAERCLGHVKRGVEGTYDRYEYRDEKKAAFAKLADLVEHIVMSPGTGFNSH